MYIDYDPVRESLLGMGLDPIDVAHLTDCQLHDIQESVYHPDVIQECLIECKFQFLGNETQQIWEDYTQMRYI